MTQGELGQEDGGRERRDDEQRNRTISAPYFVMKRSVWPVCTRSQVGFW